MATLWIYALQITLFSYTVISAISLLPPISVVICRTSLNTTAPSETSFRRPVEDDGPGSFFDSLNFFSDVANWYGLEEKLKQIDWTEVLDYSD